MPGLFESITSIILCFSFSQLSRNSIVYVFKKIINTVKEFPIVVLASMKSKVASNQPEL